MKLGRIGIGLGPAFDAALRYMVAVSFKHGIEINSAAEISCCYYIGMDRLDIGLPVTFDVG